MVDGFVEAGEKRMKRLARLLKACEGPMLKAARKKGGDAVLGKNHGMKFVDSFWQGETVKGDREVHGQFSPL